jgi:uncharacterized FlaG/YvyC family protein
MVQIPVTALRPFTQPESQNTTAAHDARVRNQALASAVQTLNQSGFVGADRQITYSTDSSTKRLIVTVVDKQSGSVVVQWPSEYAIQMAQEYLKEHPTNEPLL